MTDQSDLAPPPTVGLRDQLRSRILPTSRVPLPAEPAAYAAAEDAVQAADRALQDAQARGLLDTADQVGALDAARAALAGQRALLFELRCLAPKKWDDLVDAHPPTEAQRELGWQWNVETFRPALLAATVVPESGEQPLDVRGWVEVAEEGQLTSGELDLLFGSAVALNKKAPRLDLGKG